MRITHLKLLILSVICWTFCWQESHSRVLNKDTESLTSKLGRSIQRDIHNVRGHWAQKRKEHNESFSVDEQDAILFQYIIVNVIQTLQQSIKVTSSVIRICGDTFAGVMSGMVKATGGLLNLASKVFLFLSTKFDLAQEHSPAFLGNFSAKCAFGLKKAAPVLHYAGEVCIYSGEILESLTLGLGEAVQDSFWGLEVVSNSSNVLVKFLLQVDDTNSAAVRDRLARFVNNSRITSTVTDTTTNTDTTATDTTAPHTASKIERHFGGAHNKVNLLHPHSEPGSLVVDATKQYRSAIEIKLGKEWVAPGTATISVHDTTLTTHSTYDHNTPNTHAHNTHSTHNTHYTQDTPYPYKVPYIHINHTSLNTTNIMHKAQHLWSVVVNTTNYVIKHYTTNNTVQPAPTVNTSVSDGMNNTHSSVVNITLLTIPDIIHNYTHYILYEFPTIVDMYTKYTLHICYTSLYTTLTLVIQLYTTIVHAQHTESSQGLFFALALVATYILSILPLPNTRIKVLTFVVFGVVVYGSFITTEQILRDRLVHTTSVQSAHSLLMQQANQRSRRSVSMHNSVYDSVFSVYDMYHDSSEVRSAEGVQKEDITTSPHYEHTATQDVYSNINHHHTHTHDTHTTSDNNNTTSNNTGTTNTSTSNTTTTEETLLFDDAVWLNTLLTALWTIHPSTTDNTHTTQSHTTQTYTTHGLGDYINEIYREMVHTELSSIPPSIANVRLKHFELGRAPPLFRGVRVYRVRDHVCMHSEVYGTSGSGVDSSGGASGSSSAHTDATTSTTSTTSTATSGEHSMSAHESFLAALWSSIQIGNSTGSSVNSGGSSGCDVSTGGSTGSGGGSGSDVSGDSASTSGATSGSDSNTSSDNSGSESSASNTNTTSHPTPTPPTPPPTHTLTAAHKHLLSQFSATCDHLIIEMDTLYISDALNIALTLRNELKSVMPEVSATLTELSLAGQLRLKVQLTPDYPFIGAGQLSFLRAPQLGFSLSSLGGIELSSVPYAFHWVNSSMHWVLEQYTAPHFMELDLRGTLCPSCDAPLAPHTHDLVKVFNSAVLDKLRGGVVRMRKLWVKADAAARKLSVQLQPVLQHMHHHYRNGVRYVQKHVNVDSGSGDGGGGLHKAFSKVTGVWKDSHDELKQIFKHRDSRSSNSGTSDTSSASDSSTSGTSSSDTSSAGTSDDDWTEGVWFT